MNESSSVNVEANFLSRGDRINFWLIVIVTFCCGFSRSSQSLLSVIMEPLHRVDIAGLILSASALPMVIAALFATKYIQRHGPRQVIVVGLFLMLFGHLSFEFTLSTTYLAIISRGVEALGFGTFIPAAMIFGKSCLGKKQITYLFGILSCMILFPSAFGPSLFDLYLQFYGHKNFFVFSSIPLLLAICISFSMRGAATNAELAVEQISALSFFPKISLILYLF